MIKELCHTCLNYVGLEINCLVFRNERILEEYLIRALPQSDLDQNMRSPNCCFIHDENPSDLFMNLDLLIFSIMPPVPKHAGYSDCHPLAGD